MAEQPAVIESPVPKLESSLDGLEPGSEILKVEQNPWTTCDSATIID